MFEIILPKKVSLGIMDKSDEDIAEAIESTFKDMHDIIFINWNDIIINISCKYDLSFMINDVLNIIKFSAINKSGKLKIYWPSNTFSSVWDIQINGDFIEIISTWNVVLNNTEKLLNAKNKLLTRTNIFQRELSKLVSFTMKNLSKAGYSNYNLRDYSNLSKTLNLIKNISSI